ncbi:MAG: hypothetical protein ABII94_03910, partial [Patescibacteria group bacterium]
KNKTELTFTHIYKGKTNKIITDYTYFFDKDIRITATWNLTSKELNLYIELYKILNSLGLKQFI